MPAFSDSPEGSHNVPVKNAPAKVTYSPKAPKDLSSALVVGVLVPPVLMGIMASKTLANILAQVGLVTEQLYRGDRLPTLNIPSTETNH